MKISTGRFDRLKPQARESLWIRSGRMAQMYSNGYLGVFLAQKIAV
jgi:hypothetical protein